MFDKGDDDFIYFKNYQKTQRIPIVIYSDFECILKHILITKHNDRSKTRITRQHKLMSYAFIVKIDYSIIPKYLIKKFEIPTKIQIFSGKNPGKLYMKSMTDIGIKMYSVYQINIPIYKLTIDEETRFKNAKKCECCLKSFKKNNLMKVRDHNHFTGMFRSVLCVNCNFELKNVSFLPIYFHNLAYDCHFIMNWVVMIRIFK